MLRPKVLCLKMLTGTIFIKKSNFLDKIKSIIEPLVKSLSITKLRSLSIGGYGIIFLKVLAHSLC